MILYNAIKCDNCRIVIESHHVTETEWCQCTDKSMFRCGVTGGYAFLKREGSGYWDELAIQVDNTETLRQINELRHLLPEPRKSIDCEEGWWELIINCHKELTRLDPNYRPIQIKQKFGQLRYYYDTEQGAEVNELMHEVVQRYERQALNTCEHTGKQGATLYKTNGHYGTYNPDHAPRNAIKVHTNAQ